MKNIIIIWIIIFLVSIQSCKDECSDILCFTPPPPFEFELVDKLSGENLFTNKTFDPNDIKIINIENQSEVKFLFIKENQYNIIQLSNIGWENEIVHYIIKISSESIFELYVDAQRLNGDCCSYTEYKEIRIENVAFELQEINGVYRILIS
ncbi:MAG: hypothetical protein CMB82_04370 [Flammeovirgaceae bacterium]|nr:hypothetical protein [Flammeovirgaceae bacterium]|tara:strand:- start:3920 stop:4372 length:453 start_codon:yes stop_codon:yes gene_type:complete